MPPFAEFAMAEMSRRALLAGAGAVLAGGPTHAAAPRAGKQAAGYYRYRIGNFELTALYDGVWDSPVDAKYIRNAGYSDVQRALTDAFLPKDKLPFSYTALLVNTGPKLVLLDADFDSPGRGSGKQRFVAYFERRHQHLHCRAT